MALPTPLMPSPHSPLTGSATTIEVLRQWRDIGWIRALDCAFAEFLHLQHPTTSPLVLLGAALVSHQSGRGHLLLDLVETLQEPGTVVSAVDTSDAYPAPVTTAPEQLLGELDLDQWHAELAQCALVETPSDGGAERRPLVLDGHRVYLRRYWRYEQAITQAVETKISQRREVDEARMRELLSHLFPGQSASPSPDWQMLACALAARSQFGVITGGPGTGKTTTVVKLLALLQALSMKDGGGQPLRIRLAAPTGKAAARLNESIASQVSELPLVGIANGEAIRNEVPNEVTTLHRLLGARPNTRKFRHHSLNPLPVDLVVVDEASMIDVEMMVCLLDALPSDAGLVMLGDKDQLASVEAGAILGSLCAQAHNGHYSADTDEWLQRVTGVAPTAELVCNPARPLDQTIAMLRHSYRFGSESGIGRLARAINLNQPEQARAALVDGGLEDLHNLTLTRSEDHALEALAVDGVLGQGHGYAHFLTTLQHQRPAPTEERAVFDDWARQVLASHSQFQLLCALRRGPMGVEGLNPRIEACLVTEGYLPADAATSLWYEGRPVLVTGNDYGLKLMNGDIGIALTLPVGQDTAGEPIMGLRVAFPAGDGAGGIRWVLPSRLQRVETVFAMTVHKSQGSEFAHAALVLPDAPTPIATRELFYTAVTRAKRLFTLVEVKPELTRRVIGRAIYRASQMFPTA